MLSKETTDQIRKEAEEAVQKASEQHWMRGCATAWEEAYIKGATAWAAWKEKAEGYEMALKEISLLCDPSLATIALEQYK